MKRNCTDATSSLAGLRLDMDELDRDLRSRLKDLDAALGSGGGSA